MLNPKYKYISFDLETTGLDKKEDEIIQIAIVQFDNKGNIVKKFSSLVQPEQVNVKEFISFLTGIDNEQLKTAPKFSEIQDKILEFFDEQTIIIGHNIQFDIEFLQNYLPELPFKDSIDTYALAKQFVHFPESYALEVLVELLSEKKEQFRAIQKVFFADFSDEEMQQHHDAMTDTLNSCALFWYCIKKILLITEKYPSIRALFSKIEGLRSELVILPKDWKGKVIGWTGPEISLPSLEKSANQSATLINKEGIDLDTLDGGTSFYIGDQNLHEILYTLAGNKRTIFCFDNLHKLNIAKNSLQALGIYPWSMYDQQTIDSKKLSVFLNKEKFSVDELFFVLKYLSTKLDGYSIIQTNTPIDYKIMHYLKKSNSFPKSSLILSTHNALFAHLREEKIKGYNLVFFDADWRYKNYNQRISRPIDGYGLVYCLETLIYRYTVEQDTALVQELQGLYEKVLMFIGVFSLEVKAALSNTSGYVVKAVNPLMNNPLFEKTAELWKEIIQMQELIVGELHDDDISYLGQKVDEIDHILNSLVDISQRANYDGAEYFVMAESITFTDWSEFIELFGNYHTIFCSNNNKTYPHLIKYNDKDNDKANNKQNEEQQKDQQNTPSPHKTEHFSRERNTQKLITRIKNDGDTHNKAQHPQENKIYFVLSTKKFESQNIFNILIGEEDFSGWTILAENITWWAGKNIFKLRKHLQWQQCIAWKGSIVIGGYQFLLNLYSHAIFPDKIFIHNVYGATENLILRDSMWYGQQQTQQKEAT